MKAALVRSSHGGVVKEEKGIESSGDEEIVAKVGNGRKEDDDDNLKPSSAEQKDLSCSNELVAFITNTRRSMEEPNLKASSSTSKDQDDQLKSTKAQMGEVREENQRLRMYLDRIMKDYQTLQKQFYDTVQQEAKKSTERTTSSNQGKEDEAELVSLRLGRTTNSSEQKKNDLEQNKTSSKGKEEYEQFKEGLSLRLHGKFKVSKTGPSEHLLNPSPENSLEEAKETWPPSKILKTIRSGDDEVSLQNPAKKARVSVRARCDTPTMNDGCQWRKYGQKISKGNPCPRAYYRCTVVPTCPVRKQVQRCANDMSILITTYEGTHSHPLPISATAMASTTSAAASMLMSGSSTSQPGLSPFVSTTTTAAGLHGLNFYQSDNSKSKQFYFPNSSISSSPSNPTITIDLTSTSSSSSSHFNTLSSSNYPPAPIFSSESNIVPVSLGNGFVSYGTQSPYNKNSINIGSLNLGRQTQESFYQSYMQKNSVSTSQQSLPDTSNIAAATNAITSNPSFQSALMAALTSIIGGAGGVSHGNQSREENYGQKLKWGEHFPAVSSYNVQDITQ